MSRRRRPRRPPPPPVGARIGLGVNVLAAVFGTLAAISQISDYAQSGKFHLIWISLFAVAAIVALIGIFVVIWPGQAPGWVSRFVRYRSGRPFLAVSSVALVASLVAVGWVWLMPPPASVLYQSYVSTNADDARFGVPVVLRANTDPPRNEYKVQSVLGWGYPAIEEEIRGTHPVYDHFCTGGGEEEPCGGVRRSHYHSKDEDAPSPWPKAADWTRLVARLLDADSDGQCPHEDDVAIYRFTSTTPAGAKLFNVAARMDEGWERSELLGCLRPARG